MTGSIIRRSADGLSLSFVLVASVLGGWVIRDPAPPTLPPQATAGSLTVPEEAKHLKNVRQLTFGGQSAEAYFSLDDKYLIFQHQGEGVPCDQIYTIAVDTPDGKPATPKLVSTGKGRTTCAYFFPSGDRVLFSSTHAASPDCPPKPDYSHGYVWPIYDSYQIYTAKPDGSDVKQLTRAHGYDGGPFWSYDGKKIVYRAEHPNTPEEISDYKDLLSKGLIRPGNLEIWVMNADGSNKHQVTRNGAANFAPYWHPDGKRIVFASNMADPKNGRDFDLYLINEDGSGLERITYAPDFDAFPMFSSDGKRLVWASNRNSKAPHETNLFLADWSE